MMVRDGEATLEQIGALYALRDSSQFTQHFAEKAPAAGWHHLGGELKPFIWHTVFRVDGEIYVMAVPEAAYYTTNPEPTAVLYLPGAAGAGRLAMPVCTFQLTSF
jgi:hypothetical protein